MHDLLTVKETSQYLRMPLPTVYYLIQKGKLPAVQIGGRWRVKRDIIDRDILKLKEDYRPVVLVVDDEEGVRDLFKQFLEQYNCHHVVVEDGKAAIQALRRQPFDLMFLDLKLPDLGGDAVFEQARKEQPDLPVVIITGYPDNDMLSRILQHGPVTVLSKPLRLEQIRKTLKILAGKTNGAGAA